MVGGGTGSPLQFLGHRSTLAPLGSLPLAGRSLGALRDFRFDPSPVGGGRQGVACRFITLPRYRAPLAFFLLFLFRDISELHVTLSETDYRISD